MKNFTNKALLEAAKDGNFDNVKSALKKGADINAIDNEGKTALEYAANNKNEKIIKYLAQNGADVESVIAKYSVIEAIVDGDEKAVSSYLEKGININLIVDKGQTGLIIASMEGHTHLVRMLLHAGCGINNQDKFGNTALLMASYKGHIEIVKILLDAGADINIKDSEGKNALDLASEMGEDEVVFVLNSYIKEEKVEKYSVRDINSKTDEIRSNLTKRATRTDLKEKKWDQLKAGVKFNPGIIRDHYTTAVFVSTDSNFHLGTKTVKICIKCKEIFPLEYCPNCGCDQFVPGVSTDRTVGIFCLKCEKGYSFWECPACQTSNPVNKSLAFEESGCFIATAVYGNYYAPEVMILRRFRDQSLLPNKLGKYFVNIYYIMSPTISGYIENNKLLKKDLKKLVLNPIVSYLKKVVEKSDSNKVTDSK